MISYSENVFYMKKIFDRWFHRYRLHLLLWVLFIFYESVVVGLLYHVFGNPLTYLVHYSIIVILFYIHADVLLPWALRGKFSLIWRFLPALLIELTGFICLSFFMDILLVKAHILKENGSLVMDFQYILKTLYRDIYFLGFSTGYFFLRRFTQEKLKTTELEKKHLTETISRQQAIQELTKAQNAFLKAQINPHFLFNTLDFVYHNIEAISPDAAEAIVTLADMMRFAIDSDKMGDHIELGDEIEQVNNLLYLAQLRKQHSRAVSLTYDPEVPALRLIPLVVLTLTENMVKHGDLGSPDSPAEIRIYIDNGTLYIATYNLVNKTANHESHHKGLANIAERLRVAYGNEVVFNAGTDASNHFKVLIGIGIKAISQSSNNTLLK